MTFTVGSYTSSGAIPGLPVYRYFNVEDLDLNAIIDGSALNGDTAANAATATSAALAAGSLLPGNLVLLDTASTNGARPNVKRPSNTASTAVIAGLSNKPLGLVFGAPVYNYAPTDNAIPAAAPVSVLYGRFTAILDVNSFEASGSPTALGQRIYPSSNAAAGDLGKLSTVLVGSTGTADLPVGIVIGFEQATTYGGPGVQLSSTYSGGNGTPVLVGGVTLVRVRFDLPYTPRP